MVEGKIQSLLQTERLMLNVMQRMSGIATTTRKYAKALEGTKTHVLDTRKTTPGMRMIDSGDTFHRFSQKTLKFPLSNKSRTDWVFRYAEQSDY